MQKIDLIFRYKLWHPSQIVRLLYYNFKRIHRTERKAFLILSKYAVMDLDKTARIVLQNSTIWGWCNMKGSHIETALYMDRNSKISLGGG